MSNNKTTIDGATKIEEQQTGTYLQLFLYRAPKRNNWAIAKKKLEKFIPWFNELRGTVEYNQQQQLDKSRFFGLARLTQGKRSIKDGFSHFEEYMKSCQL